MIARPRSAAFPTSRPWRRLLAGTALTAALLAVLPLGAIAADGGKRVALVIDNGRYSGLDSRSDHAAANAGAMVSALRKAGFSVTRADNVGRVAMESALERFRESLSGADLGFVYYTGLAVGLGEREYLLPADAAPAGAEDLPRAALDLDTVLGDLRDSGRKTVVVIDPGTADALAQRVGGGALGTPMEADGLFVVYAHRPGVPPVPAQSATGAAPFTAALAREMVKPGVTFRDSLAEVARTVAERSGGRQLPWLQDRLGTTLVLVPAVAAAPKPPPAPSPATSSPPSPDAQSQDQASQATKEAPPKEPPPVVTSPSLPPGEYEMARSGVLFDRPAVGARGIAQLPAGAVVTVLEAVPEGSWLRVRDEAGRNGYVTAGTLAARLAAPPPLAARSRGTVEAGPSFGDPAAEPPSTGSSDPVGMEEQRSFPAPPPGTASTEPEGPAVAAERQAMRALGDARTAAERARSRPDSRFWTHGFAAGDRYEGTWAQPSSGSGLGRPIRQGAGVYRFANGQTYEGEWSGDLMSGYGVMTFTDGSRFAGRFSNGQPDGPGVFHYANGAQSAGMWRGSVRLDQ
ncbi:caspase family protein [Azospirillum ramasamyi]|nr:caspase family protein [Azospirillum ramasamyi]